MNYGDNACPDCHHITSGDCGAHGPFPAPAVFPADDPVVVRLDQALARLVKALTSHLCGCRDYVLSGQPSALDHEWEEYQVDKIDGPDDSGWYTIDCGGFCFGVPPGSSVTPAVGQVARFYGGGFGYPVRGLLLDGVSVFYRTVTEQRDHEANERIAYRQKKQDEFEAGGRVKLDADYLALPEEFKRRIDRFRAFRTDFRWDMEAYEMSACVDAVKIARGLRSADAVRHFHRLSWAEQIALVPGLFGGHSGNSFGMACRLAIVFLDRPDLVEKEHGALCALVGCREYGCWAVSAEADAGAGKERGMGERVSWSGHAWAIDLRLDGRPGFRGNATPPVPIALWRTRRDAREALSAHRTTGGEWARAHYWNRSRVVAVCVLIAEAARG